MGLTDQVAIRQPLFNLGIQAPVFVVVREPESAVDGRFRVSLVIAPRTALFAIVFAISDLCCQHGCCLLGVHGWTATRSRRSIWSMVIRVASAPLKQNKTKGLVLLHHDPAGNQDPEKHHP